MIDWDEIYFRIRYYFPSIEPGDLPLDKLLRLVNELLAKIVNRDRGAAKDLFGEEGFASDAMRQLAEKDHIQLPIGTQMPRVTPSKTNAEGSLKKMFETSQNPQPYKLAT